MSIKKLEFIVPKNWPNDQFFGTTFGVMKGCDYFCIPKNWYMYHKSEIRSHDNKKR